jgi:hypothetical protein
LAEQYQDVEFAAWARQQVAQASEVLERELWDDSLGYYISWRDNNFRAWDGLLGEHPRECRDSQISQIAGAQWADMLDLGEICDPERRLRALHEIARRNVDGVPGVPADEYRTDGSFSQSIGGYVLGYYASLAIASGLPDLGWRAVENIYRVRYELDGSPWDAPLQWAGERNELAQWGRWYMANPASWAVLAALGGAHIDQLRGDLWLAPAWPSGWGERLEALPVFLPGFAAVLNALHTADTWRVEFRLTACGAEPLRLQTLGVRLPRAFRAPGEQVEPAPGLEILPQDRLRFACPLTLANPGDGFTLTVSRSVPQETLGVTLETHSAA